MHLRNSFPSGGNSSKVQSIGYCFREVGKFSGFEIRRVFFCKAYLSRACLYVVVALIIYQVLAAPTCQQPSIFGPVIAVEFPFRVARIAIIVSCLISASTRSLSCPSFSPWYRPSRVDCRIRQLTEMTSMISLLYYPFWFVCLSQSNCGIRTSTLGSTSLCSAESEMTVAVNCTKTKLLTSLADGRNEVKIILFHDSGARVLLHSPSYIKEKGKVSGNTSRSLPLGSGPRRHFHTYT